MELEVDNSRLRRLVAELLLKNQQLRDAHISIFSGEFRAIRRVARMWRTVCITFRVIVGTVMTGACPLPPEEVSAACPYLRLSAWRVLLQTPTQGLTEFH
jgi:hypothetical protein